MTPIFPSVHELDSSRKGLPENVSTADPGRQNSYAEFLRDVHQFLSTQSDVLSPPSRPNTPLFDRRVQKVRDEIQSILDATGGEISSGKWTRVSQTLRLGCARGRYWSVSKADPYPPLENANWILPDEESEWIEWEKKREENRRLKGKTNASQPIGSTASTVPDSQKPNQASFAELSQPRAMARDLRPRGASPATLRAAKEKVTKWQASMASEECHDTTSRPLPISTRTAVETTGVGSKTERPQRNHTLDFTVVKPAAKPIIGKRGKASLSRPTDRSDSVPIPSRKSKSPKLSKASNASSQVIAPTDVDKTSSKKTPPVRVDMPKIADVPEASYLPPSFPGHLETSTPVVDSVMRIRAKPSPILPLPAPSSTPPPPTSANPREDGEHVALEPHPSDMPSSRSPQINTAHAGKRSLILTASSDGIQYDPLLTPPAKRLRTLPQNCSTSVLNDPKPMSPNGGLDIVPGARENPDAAPSHQYNVDSLEMASDRPLASGKNDQVVTGGDGQGFPEKIPSPTKSVKSYFSAPDSDPADSPMKANLLLESPVSPMLSYARNPSGFLPQITSTQVEKGSPTGGRTNGGMLKMGYSSQFDVEKHVDRVSELLEKDVDFEGWLQDVRVMEMSKD